MSRERAVEINKIQILLSNDDGVFAEGINNLASILSDIADITIVAPDRNRSGASNSITLSEPLRVGKLADNIFSIQGTPVDCVHFALSELMTDRLPDLIISGINHGANLGDDTLYSGTVAVAAEGVLFGVPSIAVSLAGTQCFNTAARVVLDLVNMHLKNPLGISSVLNVNVPDCEYSQLKGWKTTYLGSRERNNKLIKEKDPRGETCYWLGPPGVKRKAQEGTDFYAIDNNYVSLTPLNVDLTAHRLLEDTNTWLLSEER